MLIALILMASNALVAERDIEPIKEPVKQALHIWSVKHEI
jgi:hypothetical protein